MFNRYMDPEGWQLLTGPPQEQAVPAGPTPADDETEPAAAFSGLRKLLSERLNGISTETLVMAALVYFLVADREEADDRVSDTLLIIGALLIFGF